MIQFNALVTEICVGSNCSEIYLDHLVGFWLAYHSQMFDVNYILPVCLFFKCQVNSKLIYISCLSL